MYFLHMPITKSAKKALRGSSQKRVYNLRRKEAIKKNTKLVKKTVSEKDMKSAAEVLKAAYKALDKAAKAGTIKKGAASRKKSRLAKLINKASK